MDEEIRIPEELKPDHCNAVMATSEDGKSLFVWQNQGHPDAWSKKPMYDLLTSLAAAGVLVVISKAPGTREKIVLEVNGKGIVEKRTSRATAMDENGRQIVW